MADAENSKIQKVEDEAWRERGETRRRRVLFSIRSVFKHRCTHGVVVSALDFKVSASCLQFESVQDQFCYFLFQTQVFSYFPYSHIFCIIINSFHIFLFCILKLPKNIFFLHLYSEKLYVIYK